MPTTIQAGEGSRLGVDRWSGARPWPAQAGQPPRQHRSPLKTRIISFSAFNIDLFHAPFAEAWGGS